jgi:NTP pyrophosphatase (non-canonical NTP hydrolase)
MKLDALDFDRRLVGSKVLTQPSITVIHPPHVDRSGVMNGQRRSITKKVLMTDETTTVATLREAAKQFAAERRWEPFHNLKNLSMALATEVAELMEHFLWIGGEESHQKVLDPAAREAIADELADVTYLVLQFSVHSGIDLSQAVKHKLEKSALKYPVKEG